MQQIDLENIQKLGKRIKEIRLSRNISLNKLVMSHAGITTATWSRLENGLFDIKFSTLLKVAYTLDCSVNELLEGIVFNYSFNDEDD